MADTVTASTPTLEVGSRPATSPHARPALASAVGVAVGVLTLLETYFGTGHLPTGAEIASVLAGSGVTLGSVIAFVGHHLGALKLAKPTVTTVIPQGPTAPKASATGAPST